MTAARTDTSILNSAMSQVLVRLAWDAWKTAAVTTTELTQLHWYQPVGAPTSLLHAYVRASALVGQQCTTEDEHVRVCILKHDSTLAVYSALSSEASVLGELRLEH
jgi:hypothetical protein